MSGTKSIPVTAMPFLQVPAEWADQERCMCVVRQSAQKAGRWHDRSTL
jgi:phage terminase large subunit GpA-like protein